MLLNYDNKEKLNIEYNKNNKSYKTIFKLRRKINYNIEFYYYRKLSFLIIILTILTISFNIFKSKMSNNSDILNKINKQKELNKKQEEKRKKLS